MPQQARRGYAAHLGMQINAVQQRPGNSRAVALNLVWRTAAAPFGITEIAAGTGIHRRHQLKARRVSDLVPRPGQCDLSGFQRFAQHLQAVAAELGEFIQEQHASVGERDLSGTRLAATTGQRCCTGAVMRRAERPLEQRLRRHPAIVYIAQRQPGESFCRLRRRQNTGQAARHERLARPGRPLKQ